MGCSTADITNPSQSLIIREEEEKKVVAIKDNPGVSMYTYLFKMAYKSTLLNFSGQTKEKTYLY